MNKFSAHKLIDKLAAEQTLPENELISLLAEDNDDTDELLFSAARKTAVHNFSNHIYLRGLIEFSNYCRNDCYYCGIRCSNRNASRYRLSPQQILSCCAEGYQLGLRTFVLQGGEDMAFDDDNLARTVEKIKTQYPDCAVTLSAGERPLSTYKSWFDAGADRYLLRHETAAEKHYALLHPHSLSLTNRIECLYTLKELGYQVGTGFMVGSPYQTLQNIAADLKFIEQFKPHMVGIGPFIPHKDTPFSQFPAGSIRLTLRLLSVIRLMLPKVLLPATTALNTLAANGHTKGILAGANVIMPNLSPQDVRTKYSLYNNKRSSGSESAEGIRLLKEELAKIGYDAPPARGDALM